MAFVQEMCINGIAAGLQPGARPNKGGGGGPFSPWMDQATPEHASFFRDVLNELPDRLLELLEILQRSPGSLWPAGVPQKLDPGCGYHPPEGLGPAWILHLAVMRLAASDPLQTHGVLGS